jgi:hypothetical protein
MEPVSSPKLLNRNFPEPWLNVTLALNTGVLEVQIPFQVQIPPPISAYLSPHFLLPGIINQVIILLAAQFKPPSPFKPSGAASKPFRAPILSAEQIHAQEQCAVGYFTTPISLPGLSNVFQSA